MPERENQYRVGIEIECLIRSGFNEPPRDVRMWEHKGDSSVNVDGDLRESHNPREFYSPPLRYPEEAVGSVEGVTEFLAKHDTRVNRSCGLHVHVSKNDGVHEGYTEDELRNIFRVAYAIEDVAYLIPMQWRMRNQYCKPLRDKYDYDNPKASIRSIWTGHEGGGGGRGDRYRWMNLTRYFTTNTTVEFRNHHGSIDREEITTWMDFVVHMVKYACERFDAAEMADILNFEEMYGEDEEQSGRAPTEAEAKEAAAKRLEKTIQAKAETVADLFQLPQECRQRLMRRAKGRRGMKHYRNYIRKSKPEASLSLARSMGAGEGARRKDVPKVQPLVTRNGAITFRMIKPKKEPEPEIEVHPFLEHLVGMHELGQEMGIQFAPDADDVGTVNNRDWETDPDVGQPSREDECPCEDGCEHDLCGCGDEDCEEYHECPCDGSICEH